MINLIRNELYKIFHKKGIYVVLIITILFSLLTNYIYSTNFVSSDSSDDNYEIEDDYVKSMEASGETEDESYLLSKCYVEVYKYAKTFGDDSWQRVVLMTDTEYNDRISNIYSRIIRYELKQSTDKKGYENALKEKEELTEELNNITSEEFLNNKIVTTEAKLKSISEEDIDLISIYKAELETLEMRRNYNIAYAFDDMNDNLRNYEANRQIELSFKEKNEETLKQDEKSLLESAQEEVAISKVKIEKNIEEVEMGSNHQILLNYYNEYFIMILVIIVLVSGSIVSEEFNKGTIKLLLVKPFSRTKILFSKYITSLIMVLFAIIAPFIIQMIIGGIFFGYDSLKIPTLIYNYSDKIVETVNVFKYLSLNTLAILPEFILIATLAFALSTIFTSTSLANVITIIGVFGSDIINLIAESYEIDILKYFITLNWDLTPFLFGGSSPYKGITLPFSIMICIIYLLIMLIVTTIVFKKRNIKNI